MMKVRLDRGRCAGHALCHAAAADLFPIDEHGYSTVTEFPVPPGRESAARSGVESCPEIALSLTGD